MWEVLPKLLSRFEIVLLVCESEVMGRAVEEGARLADVLGWGGIAVLVGALVLIAPGVSAFPCCAQEWVEKG